MANPICYGDVVYLDIQDNILFSNGFYGSSLSFVSKSNLALKAFKRGLFKLYPNFSYKDISQVEQLKDQLELLKSLNPDDKLASEVLGKDLEEEQKALEERDTKLESLNDKIFRESMGNPIRFGQKFQLFHVQSQSFVRPSKAFDDDDKTMLKLDLAKTGTKNIYFNFVPMLEFMQLGEVVEYNIPLKVMSVKLDQPLVMGAEIDLKDARTELNKASNDITNNEKHFPKLEPRRKEALYQLEKIYKAGLKQKEFPENTYVRKYVLAKDLKEITKRKGVVNGDYIRISNGKVYLTAYQGRDKDLIAFQGFSDDQEQKYSNIYTLFQAMEAFEEESDDPKAQKEKSFAFNATYLPRGNAFEYGETKKYMLKHVVSGKLLACDNDGNLKLVEREDGKNGIEKVSLLIKNKPKDNTKERFIDKNSIMQLIFYDAQGKEQGILTIGKGMKLPTEQYDLNTEYFCGFKFQENYLNKILKTERYAPKVTKTAGVKSSYLKFSRIPQDESTATLLGESLANGFQKFLDYLDEFLKGKHESLREFNSEIRSLSDKCVGFEKQMYEKDSNNDLLIPNTYVQTTLREFRIYDMIYRVFFYIVGDETLLSRVKRAQEKASLNRSRGPTPRENERKKSFSESMLSVSDDGGFTEKVNYKEVIGLFNICKKIILVSFKKNHNNRYYCSQFVRVAINCLFITDSGLFSLAKFREKLEAKRAILELTKKGLWDEDLDALGQLNFYEEQVFNGIKTQETFHSVYLKLMEHISRSKAPNLQNTIRDHFVLQFLRKENVFSHIFPTFIEVDDKFYVQFERMDHRENSYRIPLEELDERLLPAKVKDNEQDDRIRMATTYLVSSLDLMTALVLINSPTLNLMIVKYYRYDTLVKVINILRNSSHMREIRQSISEIINSVHQRFFSLPFNKVPTKLQILNGDSVMNKELEEVDHFIQNSVNTCLSKSEAGYIKAGNADQIVESLKSVVTSDGDLVETYKLLKTNITLKNMDEALVVLEEVKKIFETSSDIDFEFLRASHEVVLSLIKEAVAGNKKSDFDFIDDALEIFTLIEHKMVAYAAIDIIGTLKDKNLLNRFQESSKKKSHYRAESTSKEFDSSTISLKPTVKVTPESDAPRRELSTKYGIDNTILSNAIGTFSKGWKTGEKLYGNETLKLNNIVTIEDTYKNFSTKDIVNCLLDICLMGEDTLLNQVIQQLKRIASFESLLFIELNKLTIIHDSSSLRKATDLIKIVFRLNEIAREVNFCTDNKIELNNADFDKLLKETLGYIWEIFFTIYDPSRHFRYPDSSQESEQRFKNAFLEEKKVQQDKCMKLNESAINRPFQKIFSILKVYKALLSTLEWVTKKKTDNSSQFETHTYIIRIIFVTISAYLNKNKENQELCSQMNEFIGLFYDNQYLSQSPDSITMFTEMMRDNKRLLRMPVKYLFDITMSAFMKMLDLEINDKDPNTNLTAAIMGYDFLLKCQIPEEQFSTIQNIKTQWANIAKEQFNSLNVSNYSNGVTSLPFSYYSIRETMDSTLKIIEENSTDIKILSDIQQFLTFNEWLSFFESPNYFLQFELKNLLAKCISKAYFDFGKKGKFFQDPQDCDKMLACLVYDILAFRYYIARKEKQDSTKLRELMEIPSCVTSHETYDKVKALGTVNLKGDLNDKKLRIYLEDISLETLYFEYINGGCLELFLNIILQEEDHCSFIIDKKAPIKCIMEFVLILLDEFVQFEGLLERFPYKTIEGFLSKASASKGYEPFKDKIVGLTNKLYNSKKAKGRHIQNMIFTLAEKTIEITPLDSYNHHLDELQKQKTKLKEQNIQDLSDYISKHPESEKIIVAIITYLKKDLTKLNMKDISFLLKLLRKFIEREHSNNPNDDPIYKWKDVNINDLKKIEKIQSLYKENGLTELLYTFLGLSDSKVFKETLMLSLAYMYGGPLEIQEEFFKSFTDDDENKVLVDFGNRLRLMWESFRNKESERMYHIYKQVQINLFNHYKGKAVPENVHPEELPAKAFEHGIDSKYKEYAENDYENHLFMLILNFLQSLCEGQYTNMQLFLKEQKWQGALYPNSYDFVGFLRHAINGYHKVLNRYNLAIGNKVLELINELIQGEVYSNIAVFLHKTFVYDMCRIITDYNTRYHTLPRGFGLDPFEEGFRTLKGRVIFVLKIMLENRDEKNKELLAQHLDTVGLMKTFESLMNNFLTKNNLHDQVNNVNNFVLILSNHDFKDTLGDALNIYIIYRYLWEDLTEFNDNMRDLIDKMDKKSHDMLGKVIFTICKRLVNSIEIMVETKSEPLMKIWFPVIAVCNYLNDDTQRNFINNVDRSNTQTKISGLIDSAGEFIPQMYTEYKARKRIFGFNPKLLYRMCRLLTNAIGLAVTILNLATYKISEDTGDEERDDQPKNAERALNITQIVLASCLVILWILLYRIRHQSLMWERYVDDNIKSIGFLPPTIKNKIDNGQYDDLDDNDCRLIMMLKGANSDEFKDMKENAPAFALISKQFFMLNTYFLFNSYVLIWHIIYCGICVGSIFHPIVAIFQIFDIAIRSDTIKQISSAISKNANQFIWTLFLLLVVNVVYSSIGFFFLNDQFVMDDDTLCDTAFACFVNTVNLGLRSGGGIADAIGSVNYESGNLGKFVGRAIFDLSFFIIMIILLLNLIFGMIIDAFGDLRDQKSSNDEDQKNVCFICGIERSEFERYMNFEEHIYEEHNIWSYIYYLVYLLDRQKTAKVEMTDIENLVLTKHLQKDSGWVPIGKSLALERIYSEEKEAKESELETISKKVDTIQKNVTDIDVKVSSKIDQLVALLKK